MLHLNKRCLWNSTNSHCRWDTKCGIFELTIIAIIHVPMRFPNPDKFWLKWQQIHELNAISSSDGREQTNNLVQVHLKIDLRKFLHFNWVPGRFSSPSLPLKRFKSLSDAAVASALATWITTLRWRPSMYASLVRGLLDSEHKLSLERCLKRIYTPQRLYAFKNIGWKRSNVKDIPNSSHSKKTLTCGTQQSRLRNPASTGPEHGFWFFNKFNIW